MKIDLGLSWAKFLAVYGQVASILGVLNSLMLVGIFYTTTLKPVISIPLWLYLMAVLLGIGGVIVFVQWLLPVL